MTPPPTTNREIWDGVSVGWSIVSYLLAGVLFGWAAGLGLDHLAGTFHVFMAIGMVLGMVVGIYLVYVHYGRPESPGNPQDEVHSRRP